MRADQALVARGLAPSRTAAQRLIQDGAVRLASGVVLSRPAQVVSEHEVLQVHASDETRFVSRAGAKLMHALVELAIDPQGLEVLDLGQSTGGFTDCLLQHGAARVIGIEVGHGQLHANLRADPRVICLEHTHLRDLEPEQLQTMLKQRGQAAPMHGFPMAVADLSFISLTKVLPAIDRLLRPEASVLMLVKPQFELGPTALNARGVVRSTDQARQAVSLVAEAARATGWRILAHAQSAVRGTDGNLEFFLHAQTGPHRLAQGSPS
ncbi:MAG: TlyA family RNA methyltransferase [Burkholderiaceae bacterium]